MLSVKFTGRPVLADDWNDLAYAACERYPRATAWVWDGDQWGRQQVPTRFRVFAMSRIGQVLHCVGERGLSAIWEPGSSYWLDTSHDEVTGHFFGVWSSEYWSWVVGDGGAIYRVYSAMMIPAARQDSGVDYRLYGVHGSSASNVWAVGRFGTVLRSTGQSSWKKIEFPKRTHLYGVWVFGAGDVWVVGDYNTIMHLDGKRWIDLSPGDAHRNVQWRALWAAGSDDIWFAGFILAGQYGSPKGVVAHWDGNSMLVDDSFGIPLTAISGVDSDNIVIVGANQSVYRRVSGSWVGSSISQDPYEHSRLADLRCVYMASSQNIYVGPAQPMPGWYFGTNEYPGWFVDVDPGQPILAEQTARVYECIDDVAYNARVWAFIKPDTSAPEEFGTADAVASYLGYPSYYPDRWGISEGGRVRAVQYNRFAGMLDVLKYQVASAGSAKPDEEPLDLHYFYAETVDGRPTPEEAYQALKQMLMELVGVFGINALCGHKVWVRDDLYFAMAGRPLFGFNAKFLPDKIVIGDKYIYGRFKLDGGRADDAAMYIRTVNGIDDYVGKDTIAEVPADDSFHKYLVLNDDVHSALSNRQNLLLLVALDYEFHDMMPAVGEDEYQWVPRSYVQLAVEREDFVYKL